MFKRQTSIRLGLAVTALVLISGLTFTADLSRRLNFGAISAEAKTETVKSETNRHSALPPLSGTYNIPGDYADLAAAITDLNTQGVSGAVVLNLVAGNPQTAPAGGYVVGGTGTAVLTTTSAVNTVTIQGNGNTITASPALTVGALNDGIFKIIGADWITVTGFTMNENAANIVTTAASNTMTEWGVALLYVTATDGAQNNTISANTIDLNRTYQNTFGIYSNSTHTATAVTTSATATGAAGSNAPLTITTNNITDVNNGIVVVGPTAAADHSNAVTIGGTAPNANTITNFGTTGTFSAYANVSGTVNGILVRNSKNTNVSFNSITSSVGGVTVGTLNGIQFPAFSATPTGTFVQTVSSNTISLQSGLATGAMNGINCPSGSASTTSGFDANNNNFVTWGHTVAASGTITFITNASTHLNQSISGNTFTNITVNTTGSVTFISNTNTLPAGGAKLVNSNAIVTAFNKTGAGGTITFFTDNGSDPVTANNTSTSNNFSNITVTGGTTIAGLSNTNGGAPIKSVNNNTISNITGGTGNITAIAINFDGGTTTATGNTVSNISGAGTVTGISLGTSSATPGVTNLSQNTVNTLSGTTSTSLVTGILVGGSSGTRNVFRNKIYDLSNSSGGSALVVQGIGMNTTLAATSNIYNNLIGDLRAPSAATAGGTDSVRGFSNPTATTSTTINFSFNTIYLNASSVGATFSTAGVSTIASATATTAAFNSRNNIIVNTSTPAGAGETIAYRRSGVDLANYGSVSNNNLYYAGTPGASNLIFTDGTNDDQTLAAFKTRVAPRDSASVTENPPFLSTTGSSPNFLHINPAIATQVESGGIPITGITDDFDGNARNVSTPDIGADEGTFILLDTVAPTITYTALGNTTLTTNRTLSITVADPGGVASGANSPRIYFKKSTDGSYVSTQCTMTGGTSTNGTYDCVINYALVGGGSVAIGDVIQYFVVAQDTSGNVGANPSAGFAATDVNNVTSPPTVPNSYMIVAAFPSSVNVPGDYASLTNAGGLFEAMNAGVFTGNTTVNITADLAGELGTHALNQLNEEGGGAGTYTLTIRPTVTARSITGSNATALIKLNGADRVTIEGYTPDNDVVGGTPSLRELTITNTGAGAVVWIATNATSGANNNTIRNAILIGGGAFTGQGIIAGSGATFGANAENGRPNSNNTIQNNRISRVQNAAFIAGDATTLDQNWTITENDIGSSVVADKLSFRGFFVSNSQNFTISQNVISGINSSTGTSSTMSGIQIFGNINGGTITRNQIKDIRQNNTTGWGSNGIYLTATSTASNLTISNNFISDIASQGFNGNEPADNGYGIVVEGSGGGYNIWHNTVVMNTNQVAATGITAAYLHDDSATTAGAVNLRNNILSNTQTVGVQYSIYVDTGTAAGFSAIDFNNYHTVENVGFLTSARVTLANWQTATGQDASSLSIIPGFVSATDLHLTIPSAMLQAGTTTAVTNDYDNDPRPATQPDIGADELVQQDGAGNIAGGTYYNALFNASPTNLTGNVTITNTLYLGNQVNTGANTLTIGCNASIVGFSALNYIVGNLEKEFCAPGAFTFPVGENGYAPVNVNVTTGTFPPAVGTPPSLTVASFDETLFPFMAAQSLKRNWSLTEDGDLTADLVFNYPEADVVGTESDYRLYKRDTGAPVEVCGTGCVDEGANTASIAGQTSFSRWGIAGALQPTAASVDIGGRVTMADGLTGLPRVRVTISGSTLPEPRVFTTNPFGYYNFADLPVGTYVLTVDAKLYTFSVPTRVVTAEENITNADFMANP